MNKKYKKVDSKFYLIKNSKFFPCISLGKLLLPLAFIFTISSFGQDADPVKGKALFNSNCAACHKLDKKMTGPALRGVEDRLYNDEGLDREWLYKWIRNSSSLIKSGDDYANKIYAEYNGSAMTAFPQLSDLDIDNILAYTDYKPEPVVVANALSSGTVQLEPQSSLSQDLVLVALIIILLVLITMLYLVNKMLRDM